MQANNKSTALALSFCVLFSAISLMMGCTPADPDPIQPTLGSIQQYVFNQSCMGSGCHGPVPIHDWDLTVGNAYDTLVGVQSRVEPDYYLVKPGDPDNSLLVKKLEGTSVSAAMPFLGFLLPDYKIAAVREWITNLPPMNLPPLYSTPQADLNWIQTNVFDVSCAYSGCHDSVTVASNLDLSVNALDNMAGILSSEWGVGLNIIEPGDPANSYLVRKLRGTQSSGVRMPFLVPALSEEKIVAIENWIAAMAPIDPPPTTQPGTLEWAQANVFNSCTSCHGVAATAGMDLRDGYSYANLVGIPSTSEPGKYRVVPGNADASYLIQKLEGSQSAGTPMPPPLGGVSQESIDNIRAWINSL